MELTQILLTISIITLFCLGWRTITDEGRLFGFARGWALKTIDKLDFTYELFKPIILCITCFSSFWGIIIFYILHGITVELMPYMVICCISASFTNTILWKLYDK